MGANHARVISESLRASLDIVIDLDSDRAGQLADRYQCDASHSLEDALRCDAAILATSTAEHLGVAQYLLEHGIPLLIEKPVASNLDDAKSICDAAERLQVPIACGFVERFNSVLDATREFLVEEPMHIVTLRHSPRTPRVPNSVVYDLLIHDIDLVLRFMTNRNISRVTGASWAPAPGQSAEIADCTLQFEDGALATLSASRAGQRKIRNVQLFTPTTLFDLDLLRADLTIYRNVRQEQPDDARALTYRAETIVDIPFVRHTGEPLARQFDHFLDLVAGRVDMATEIAEIIPPHLIAQMVEDDCTNATTERVSPRNRLS
jgi:predicted dehydrogenase